MQKRSKLDPYVFWPAIAVLLIITAVLVSFQATIAPLITQGLSIITHQMDWVFEFLTFGIFVMLVWFAAGRYGKVRFGEDTKTPAFGNFSYGAMLFCAGMGTSIMFWSIIEPMYYYQGPPFQIEGQTAAAAEWALSYGLFHWGVSAWAIYTLPTIVIAYSLYNKGNKSLKISQACKGVLGHSADGWLGRIIDILVIWSLVGGLGTSLGLGVPMIAAGIGDLFGVEQSALLSIGIILIWSVIYLTSATLGLEKGISKLSNLNVYLAVTLALFVLIVGPTSFLLAYFTDSVGQMAQNFLRMSFYTDPVHQSGFPQDWTVFYWVWFACTAPFLGLFVARISKGRTIKSVIVNMLAWGTLGGWLYFAVMGGYAMDLQLTGAFNVVQSMADNGNAQTIINVLNTLPLAKLAVLFFVVLGFIFLATSLDSASFVLASTASTTAGDGEEPAVWHTVTWGILMAVLAISLLLIGGLKVVQSSTVMVAIPILIIYILLTVSILRWLRQDHGIQEEQ
ncbi:BCCT family transporter [Marinobacter adhaerens]|uniref:BCCT family transporter n=1 Tax=Marinobacter adhaerens TaxID=1033846 RepID=A0A851I065_9GAMM|nr:MULTISPECIES: BCCT family transporter [Marinobacter]NWN92882.1 BCCT family transporter [Marinobacter adhaerens]